MSRLRTSMSRVPFQERQILVPPVDGEWIEPSVAARRAERDIETIRRWIHADGIGIKVRGRYRVSGPALQMILSNDQPALEAYHRGDRSSELVRRYFSTQFMRQGSAIKAA